MVKPVLVKDTKATCVGNESNSVLVTSLNWDAAILMFLTENLYLFVAICF